MFFCTFFEKTIYKLYEHLCEIYWSLDEAPKELQNNINNKSTMIIIWNVIIGLFIGFTMIVNLPIFGDQSELFLCIRVFDEYFGKFALIPYFLYFSGFPYLCYAGVRLAFTLLYGVLHLEVQIFLLEDFLVKISESSAFLNNSNNMYNTLYQKQIEKKLRICVRHHINLIRYWFIQGLILSKSSRYKTVLFTLACNILF